MLRDGIETLLGDGNRTSRKVTTLALCRCCCGTVLVLLYEDTKDTKVPMVRGSPLCDGGEPQRAPRARVRCCGAKGERKGMCRSWTRWTSGTSCRYGSATVLRLTIPDRGLQRFKTRLETVHVRGTMDLLWPGLRRVLGVSKGAWGQTLDVGRRRLDSGRSLTPSDIISVSRTKPRARV
ncbi:hypothetical protein PHYPSEUDO_009632 [Phytophthora pseudosyringae]|uniref:Uncharacterized protein n=1 Tax=Phytophthora pseudosyringae TaxID=221518 RepID=A0A8T1WLX8_9STRA|nr:hypothetical protein PHYPSEUDO_009632 [Phytophthora pseudosyringae]